MSITDPNVRLVSEQHQCFVVTSDGSFGQVSINFEKLFAQDPGALTEEREFTKMCGLMSNYGAENSDIFKQYFESSALLKKKSDLTGDRDHIQYSLGRFL